MFSYSVKRNKVFSVVAVWIMLLATAVFVSPGFAGAIAENPEDFAIVSDGNGGVKITGLSDKGKDAAKDGAVKIPTKVNNKPVTEIGNRAFRDSGLNSVEFVGALKNIGEGAFQGNDIDKIDVKAEAIGQSAFAQNSLKTVVLAGVVNIGSDAFRDNKINDLDLGDKLEEIGSSAFLNNDLDNVNFPASVKKIGDTSFTLNKLREVDIPDGVTELGDNVFSRNGSWVKLVTESKAAKTVKYDSGFGQVLNPVTIRVSFVDDKGKEIQPDKTYGDDLEDKNNVFGRGEKSSFEAPKLGDYDFVSAEFNGEKTTGSTIEFTPDKDDFEIKLTYKEVNRKPVLSGVDGKSFKSGDTIDKAALLKGVTAKDYKGVNITDKIEVSPSSIPSDASGKHEVTYSVTDSEGRTTTSTATIVVGIDWGKLEVGGGWLVEDFTYNGDTVTGFSDSGRKKFNSGNTKVFMPTHSTDGRVVTRVGDSAFLGEMKNGEIGSWGNVTKIGETAFSSNQITTLPDSWGSVTTIDSSAFSSNKITTLPDSWGSVTKIGDAAFSSNQITTLPDSWGSVTTIGDAAFYNNKITTLPGSWGNVTTIGGSVFRNNQITTLPDSWGNVTAIGDFAFHSNQITTLPDSWGNITTIGRSAFHKNQITTLPDSWGNVKTIGDSAFLSNQITTRDFTMPSKNLTSDFVKQVGKSSLRKDYSEIITITTDDRQNPNNAENANRVIVNPAEVRLKYVDKSTGKEIAKTQVLTQADSTKDYYPAPIYGYKTPEKITISKSDGPVVERTFLYEKLSDSELSDLTKNSSISIETTRDTDQNKKYYITEKMGAKVKVDRTGFNSTSITNPTIRVSFPDPSVFDIDKVKVSDDPSLKVSNVKKFDTFFEFTLNRTIVGGDSITVPFTIPFKHGITPEDTPFKVYAELVDGGKTVALSNTSEFVGFYHDPSERMTTRESKDYNGHVLDYDQTKVGQDSFVADSGDNDLTYDIRFDRLERNVGKYTVTVPLPTYDVHPKSKTFKELSDKGTLLPGNKALAVFDPKDNPGWKLDGTNLVYVGDAENKQSIPVPRLSLKYPGAVENSVIAINSTATLVPYDKPDTENVMMTSASTSNFFYKLVPNGEVFAKHATYPQYRGVTFYDNTRSKNEVFGWSLVFNSNKHGLTNMEFMDRDLDSRMYYTSVVAPNGVGKFTVTSYDKDGASLSTTVLDSGERMDFPEHYAREIAKVSIRANDRIAPGKYGSIRLETKLRDPSAVKYDATAGSKKNTFLNYVDFTSDEANGTSYSFKAMQAKDQTITATKRSSFHGDTITGDDGNYSVGFYAAPGFGETIRNFIQLDLVPEGVGVTGYTMSDKFAKLPGARVEAIDNYKNTGRTAIIWRANEVPYDAVTPGSVFNVGTIGINIDITRQDGDMRNEVFVKADGTELDNKITSPDPAYPFLDKGVWSRAGVTDGVKAGESMQQRKQIRKYNADGKPGLWLDGIETTPGEKFDYRLRVMNGTDRPRNNVAMYDVLPYVGDHGLDESSANRESKFANTIDTTRKPTVPKGMKIQYYNSNNPVPEYNLSNADNVLSKLNWSDTPSANTKAIRVVPVSTMTLDARSSLEVILPMKANNETSSPGQPIPANLNQKAWNSFYEKDSVQTRLIEGNRVYNTMVGTPVTVKFNKVTKSGDSTTPVEGAIFSYQRADGTTVATVKSGADGVVEFRDISPQPGDTIVETSAPKGFLKSSETRVITAETLSKLGNSKLITLGDFYNDVPVIPTPPPAGNLTFNKVDVNGKPLANVTFQLKRTVTEKDATGNTTTFDQVFEAKSNAEGKVLFRNVAAGSGYTLSEVKAPGHLKEITPISSITIKDKETATLPNTTNNTVKNDTVKLSITKLGVNDDKLTNDDGSQKKFGQFQAIDGTKLSGAKLDIVEVSSGKTITSVTSNKDGAVYASNLKPNTLYRIVESTKPAGYESIPNFPMEFKVDANGRLTDSKGKEFPTQSSLFVPNRQEEKFSIVTLNKTDGNDAPLPGAEFILEKENSDGSWSTYKGSSQKNPLSSDSNGVISWDHLSGGKYRIRETSAPQGYALNKRMIEFAVSKYQDKTFTFKAKNNKITPRINKVEYLARSLDKDSAEFVKAKAEDNANVRLVQSGNTYDVVRSLPNARFTISKTADGKPFETVTSDKDGIATIKTALDENETYYIREVSAPEGYTGKTEPMAFSPRTFTVKDGFDGTIDVFFNNSKKTGTLVVSKLNSATGSPLTGDKTATFTVKSKSDPNFVKTITTDSKTGTAVLDKLPFGEYTIQETTAPDGFILDKTVSPFTVSDENPAYTHIMGNDPQNPSVDIVKKINGYDANNSLSAVMLNTNDSKMTVTMDVTNNGNTPLENVTITDVIHNSKTQQINDLLKNATVITKNNDNAKLGTTSGEAINGKFTLIPGATAHISLTVDAPTPNTLHTDTATVTGSYNGSTVTDDDPANAYKIDTAFPLPATGAQGLVTLGISALILIAGAVYMSRRRA